MTSTPNPFDAVGFALNPPHDKLRAYEVREGDGNNGNFYRAHVFAYDIYQASEVAKNSILNLPAVVEEDLNNPQCDWIVREDMDDQTCLISGEYRGCECPGAALDCDCSLEQQEGNYHEQSNDATHDDNCASLQEHAEDCPANPEWSDDYAWYTATITLDESEEVPDYVQAGESLRLRNY